MASQNWYRQSHNIFICWYLIWRMTFFSPSRFIKPFMFIIIFQKYSKSCDYSMKSVVHLVSRKIRDRILMIFMISAVMMMTLRKRNRTSDIVYFSTLLSRKLLLDSEYVISLSSCPCPNHHVHHMVSTNQGPCKNVIPNNFTITNRRFLS